MFATVPLLNSEEVKQFTTIAKDAKFVDGSYSNPNSKIKNNLQMAYDDPNYNKLAAYIHDVLTMSEEVKLFASPLYDAPSIMSKYTEGMFYGAHADSPLIPAGKNVIRSDISCTIFLSDPSLYVGGELCLHLGDKFVTFKPAAGWAVLYPSNLLHEVLPVTGGERLAMITFIESHIKDSTHREILYKLNELKREELSWGARTDLAHISACLHRMWS